MWYTSIDGSPGFTTESFDVLKSKAEEFKANGKVLNVCLIFDEMAVRKHSQWDCSKKEFIGHVTAGKPKGNDEPLPLARESLVFMISGIGEDFKIPIGYFLVSGLDMEEKATLINEAITRIGQTGVRLVALTFDGLRSNLSCARLLGVDFEKDKTYFMNMDNNSKIYVILDPSHMLKLHRNCTASKEILYDKDFNEIKWSYIVALDRIQRTNKINLGNKLTKTHIQWEDKKMNVRIAAQTFSNSVANSIDFARAEGHEEFEKSEATVAYIRIVNNLFDLMNTKRNHTGGEFKEPISERTVDKFMDYFEFARDYLKKVHVFQKDKLVPIISTKLFTPFFGFVHNMNSLMGIFLIILMIT